MTAYVTVKGRGEGNHADHVRFYWPSELLVVAYDADPYLAVYAVDPDEVKLLPEAFQSGPSARCTKVAVSKGGRFLAATGDSGVRVYERLPDGYFPIFSAGGSEITTSVAFSHDTPLLLAVGEFNAGVRAYRVDLSDVSGTVSGVVELASLDPTPAGPVWDLKFSPDGRYLAAAHGGGAGVGQPPNDRTYTPNLTVYTVSADEGSFSQLDPFQNLAGVTDKDWPETMDNPLSGVALSFTSDSKTLALAMLSDITQVYLYHMNSYPFFEIEELTYTQANGGQSLAYHGDDILAHAFWGATDQVAVYNTTTGSVVASGLGIGFEATEVAFSEGQVLAVSCTRGATPVNVFSPVYEELPDGSQGDLIGFTPLEITDMVAGEANSLAFASAGNVLPPEEE